MKHQDSAVPVTPIDGRLGCSTISFRAAPPPEALAQISAQGFGETDLGSPPGVCDHVPIPLRPELVDVLARQIRDSGVAVRLINADIGDMDDPELDEPMLPCGRQGTAPRTEPSADVAAVARSLTTTAEIIGDAELALLVEAPHSRRLCADLDRSEMLYEALGDIPVGAVLDLSHVVASTGDETDAVRRFRLELETHDIDDADRPAEAGRAGRYITGLLPV